jgi:hypothetical protein
MDPKKIYDFAFKFFSGLGCELSAVGNKLHVSKVPLMFEKYAGVKGPYSLIFIGDPLEGEELLDSESFLLKAMGTYLEERGKTTLLKMDFNADFKDEVRKLFRLMNCEIDNILESREIKYFERFSFESNFQYLNEKKQHSEIDEDILKLKHQISELGDSVENSDRVVHLRTLLNNLENSDEKDKALKEESFFIKDEIRKHALEVYHKLSNVAVIYYPVFVYHLFLKNKNSSRSVHIKYNPFERKFSKLFCDGCNSKLDEIIICGSGHLICRQCGDRCPSCGEVYCKKCVLKKCDKCSLEICSSCASKCFKCRKIMCSKHGEVKNGQFICQDCTSKCSFCGENVERAYLKIDLDTGREICLKCHGKKVSEKALEGIGFS